VHPMAVGDDDHCGAAVQRVPSRHYLPVVHHNREYGVDLNRWRIDMSSSQ
jgi:hypothetical protein